MAKHELIMAVAFDSAEEKQKALAEIPENMSKSDFARKKLFDLPPRTAKA